MWTPWVPMTRPDQPTVIKDGGLFEMWYVGGNSISEKFIIYCDSENGIDWDNFELAIEPGAAGADDSLVVQHPMVINDNGVGRMWYKGTDSIGVNRVIYCEAY